MTVCIATTCDEGKTLVLASDRMIGLTTVEAELEIEKRISIHPDWSLLYAGDDYTPVFDIADYIAERLDQTDAMSVLQVRDALLQSYNKKRLEEAEDIYIKSRGSFPIPEEIKLTLSNKVAEYQFSLDLLVAGFQGDGTVRIISLEPRRTEDAKILRHDSPGFWAIGSGSEAAVQMLYRRKVSPTMPAREALYFTLEAKYFAESAFGVGPETDLSIRRRGMKPIIIGEDTIEEILFPEIIYKLEPKPLGIRHITILNHLNELEGRSDFQKIQYDTQAEQERKMTKFRRDFMQKVFPPKR